MAQPPVSGAYDTANAPLVRSYLGTYGLVPPAVQSFDTQKTRCLRHLDAKQAPLDKFEYLAALRRNDVHLFYRLVIDHLTQLTPLIYTPVVGEACQRWSDIYSQPDGLYVSLADRGNVAAVVANWPAAHVDIAVVTDGSRILGLGDLGVNGMGIPVGKLALYTACAGIRPDRTLPLTIDVGTDNQALLDDPLYLGARHPRAPAAEQDALLDELVAALKARWPGMVIQFEDFKNPFPALARFRNRYTCFNDDVQGTGAVILGGVIGALKRIAKPVDQHRLVFVGAGSAGVGVARQICDHFVREGMPEHLARSHFWLTDSRGLITADRGDKLAEHKQYFARSDNNGLQLRTLDEVVDHVKPTILMGLSTIGGIFTPQILRKMADWNERPIVFPLSNPSSLSECDFASALDATDGRVLFASGSPFPPQSFTNAAGVERTYYPGQGNNMYVFPGIGLGTIVSRASCVTDDMIYASAAALADSLLPDEVEHGLLYPDLERIRDVSAHVAAAVVIAAQRNGVAREPALEGKDNGELQRYVRERMYEPAAETQALEHEVGRLLSGIAHH